MRILPFRFGRVKSLHFLTTIDRLPVVRPQPSRVRDFAFPVLDRKAEAHYHYTMRLLRASA